jgi:small subunit ribosomal protein S6e
MPEFKIVVSDPKTGKAKTVNVKNDKAKALIGLKIGEVFDGSLIGLSGVKLKITGGSDRSGFPMLAYLQGPVKKSIILTKDIGFKPKKKGLRKRKTVRGNTIAEDTALINVVIVS